MDNNVFDYSFVKDHLKYIGLSQRALAKKIGAKQSNLNRWLNGAATPTLYYVAKIAKVLNLTIDEIVIYVETNE